MDPSPSADHAGPPTALPPPPKFERDIKLPYQRLSAWRARRASLKVKEDASKPVALADRLQSVDARPQARLSMQANSPKAQMPLCRRLRPKNEQTKRRAAMRENGVGRVGRSGKA